MNAIDKKLQKEADKRLLSMHDYITRAELPALRSSFIYSFILFQVSVENAFDAIKLVFRGGGGSKK